MKGFENRKYINYVYSNYQGLRGLVHVDNEKCALEPINNQLHEGFVNNYVLYDVCTVFNDIQKRLDEKWGTGVWELADSHIVMDKYYLQLLIDHRISHMSICIHNYRDGAFISRLDCLDRDQFYYMTQALRAELAIMTHFRYKLYELPRFKWEGI